MWSAKAKARAATALKAKATKALVAAAVRGELTKVQVLRLCKQDPELVVLALLDAGRRIAEQDARLAQLAAEEHHDGDARRLTNRLRKYAEYIFTFLDYARMPFENNFAERQIRPAVILRKNSQSNRSDRGAATQAVLMSVYRTLKLRGLNPTKTVAEALKTYLTTSQLPPLPHADTANG